MTLFHIRGLKMNILYINHYAGSFELGMEFRPWLLSEEWQSQGHNTRVVASDYSHLRLQNKNFDDDFHIEKLDERIEYQWVNTPLYKVNGIKRFINILVFVFKITFHLKKLTKNFKPDVVIASSTYPLDIFPAYLISKIYGAKLVHEVHDLWPLTLKELGGFKSWHPLIILFQIAEDFSYRFSDRVVSMLPGAWNYMNKHGLSKDRFVAIPNGVRIEEWDDSKPLNQDMLETIKTKKREGYFLVGYAGSIGIANALEFFIDALAEIQHQKIFVFIVGQGPSKEELISRARDLNVKNIQFLNAVGKAQVPEFLKEMDALYIGWQKKKIYMYGTNPNKLLDYMMSSKPIIHSVTASNDWVSEGGAGISVPAEDSKAIAEAIIKMSTMNPEERLLIGKNGREFVENKHSYPMLARKFLEGL
jgi:glycosyltransferase involved in cell wall biosynthesis